jgi:predicted Ser/Thr protein kinase/tetratricopeptide (TPR) repeat protein
MSDETADRACDTCGTAVDAESNVCRVCVTAVQSESATTITPSTGRGSESTSRPEIPGYTILGALGEGGMGAVYLAEETALGRRVAIKVISGRIAGSTQSKARFLREARTLATVEHPHVVRVYSFGEVGGRPYLAMEYVEGETLADRIAAGPLPVDDALRITRDVVDALEAAWEKKIVHRDIKPSNILIDKRNRVRVADFGLAKGTMNADSDVSLTQSGLMIGTPHYISPEQAQGKESDFRADFYSLGIMLFHMLTGERPFEGSTPVAIVAQHLHEPVPRRRDLPAHAEELIQWLTQKDPEKRPSSHRELLDAIGHAVPRQTVKSLAPRSLRSFASLRMTVAAGLALLMLAVIAAIIVARRKPASPLPFARPESRFVVAVTPFYGPDPESSREGRVMSALIERSVAERLGAQARVLGIEETKTSPRSHDEARELGTKLHADAVIWGEALALRRETEIVPHVTLCKDAAKHHVTTSDIRSLSSRADPLQAFSNAEAAPLKLEAEAPNQIELRRTSASGIGDMVLLLAGIHALEMESDSRKALALLDQVPQSDHAHRYRVQALLRQRRHDEARAILEGIVQRDPADAASHALIGDLALEAHDLPRAASAYRAASATKKPFTTARGIVFDDELYVQETFRSPRYYAGSEVQTLSMLAIDPATNRVLARHALPGPIASFRIDGDALVLTYNSEKDDQDVTDEVRFRGGQFDRPIYPPPNYLWRMRDVRGARVIAVNFIASLEGVRSRGSAGGRLELTKEKLDEKAPKTFADLESALRAEIERDPTQPWHPFLLALLLRDQKRDAEAQASFNELLRGDYGIHYYQYSWMMNMLERLRYDAWSDALFRQALAGRKRIAQPVAFSVLLERLINASFLRQAAANADPARGYRVMQDARALSGITPEAEDLVAGMWARHFEARGDRASAERERGIMRATQAHAFNYLGAAANIDYALTIVAAAMLAFVLLVASVTLRRRDAEGPLSTQTLRSSRPFAASAAQGDVRRLVRVIASAVLLAAALIAVAFFVLVQDSWRGLLALALLALVLYALRRARISPAAILASVSRRERQVVGLAAIVVLLALVYTVDRIATGIVIAQTPLGLADGFGHTRIVRSFEKLLDERGEGRPALVYVTAVANHYAGNHDRARTLYDSAASMPNTAANRAALLAGRMPAAHPTSDELVLALGGTRVERWRDVTEFDSLGASFAMLIAILVMLALPLLAFVAVPPRDGLPDASPLRRYCIFLLLAMPLLPVWSVLRSDAAVPPLGIVTTWNLPTVDSAYPLPPDTNRFLALLDYPGARVFWTFVALSFVVGLALTLKRRQRLDVVRVREEVQQVEAGELPS